MQIFFKLYSRFMGDTLSAVRQSPLLTNLLQFEIKKM